MQHVLDLKMFFLDKDLCDILELVTYTENTLRTHAIEVKKKSKQTAMTIF